ncbi:MAG TPA: hypothetical protein PLB79_04840, partial [Thermotogota bacterium]|nr:hypothetical protein [Thermotogota bacterium]
MLREMRVQNALLFKQAEMAFEDGFCAVTGETGAGKSMFVSLLRSLSGELKGRDLLGPFGDRFSIETLWDGSEQVTRLLSENDLPQEDGLLLKVAGTEERLSYRVNGSLASANVMREIANALVSIHSQNAFQNLRNPLFQTAIVDGYRPQALEEIARRYREGFRRYQELKALSGALPTDTREMARALDFLAFQIEEIEKARLVVGEDERVFAELRVLSNFEFLKNNLLGALAQIEGEGDFDSIADRLGEIASKLKRVNGIETAVEGWEKLTVELSDTLHQLRSEISAYLERMDYDEGRLREVSARYDLIESLKRKYGKDIPDVLARLEAFREEKAALQEKMSLAEHLDEKIEAAKHVLSSIDAEWRALREKNAAAIEASVVRELADLRMEKTRLAHEISPEEDFTAHGGHTLEWTASINPGMPFLPISKIASGGELSRIFLALELALKESLSVKTLVFDEVDSGVGPRMGHVVGDKIK